MLGVVEHEQDVLIVQIRGQRPFDRLVRQLAHAQRRGDALCDEAGGAGRGQVHEPNAVAVAIEYVCRQLQRDARLADAARTGDREQTRLADRFA